MQMNADTFFDMIINKDLQINIDKTFYIDEIKEAQSILEERKTTGSVVLKF
jgi:NADPH:quinone reductase-like Zn-dependent oxidoreductase